MPNRAWSNGRVDIGLGLMPVLNDFDASPLYCNFMSNGLCGNPKQLPGADIGMSYYPDGVWGGRIRVRPTAQTYIQTGVYEVNQGLYTTAYDPLVSNSNVAEQRRGSAGRGRL